MHGNGTLTYKDGGSYKGQFLNDVKHGKGIYTWASGKVYDGNWINGK